MYNNIHMTSTKLSLSQMCQCWNSERPNSSYISYRSFILWWVKYKNVKTLLNEILQSWHCVDANLCNIFMCLTISFHRFREVLATNNTRPWEIAPIFKQVLRDFLRQKQYNEEGGLSVQPEQRQPMEVWTSRYRIKQGFVTPTVPNCRDHPREEIPTISGSVDQAMRHSSSVTANRDRDLPYYYPVSLRPKGAYSTTLWEDTCSTPLWTFV